MAKPQPSSAEHATANASISVTKSTYAHPKHKSTSRRKTCLRLRRRTDLRNRERHAVGAQLTLDAQRVRRLAVVGHRIHDVADARRTTRVDRTVDGGEVARQG